jgi:hypothetical protein
MSFEKDGFLSSDIDRWILSHRDQHRAWFDLAYYLNRVAVSIIKLIVVKPDENATLVASLLFMRGLSSFESAILLAERGLSQDARTLVRGCFETAFYLGALRNDPAFVEDLVRDDADRRGKLARALTRLPDGSGLSEVHIETLRSFDASIKTSGTQPKPIGILAAAEKAKLVEIYETYYRGLSNDASHPSITALNRHAESSPDGDIIGLHWRPGSDDLADTVNNICTAGIYIVAYGNELFGSEEPPDGLSECWETYERLVDTAAHVSP